MAEPNTLRTLLRTTQKWKNRKQDAAEQSKAQKFVHKNIPLVPLNQGHVFRIQRIGRLHTPVAETAGYCYCLDDFCMGIFFTKLL
jgi:hypothetical protein